MYGGHITDDWDRRLCKTYLGEYMKPELVRKVEEKAYCECIEDLTKYTNIATTV